MAAATKRTGRRGRLPAGEREQRRREVLAAALDVLVDGGVEAVTMNAVARRAGASKETLYSWFGNRDGLFRALIESNADGAADRVAAALAGDADPRATLTGFAAGLLRLLTAPPSIELNRASMGNPDLAATLLAGGRYRVGPIVERYLERLDATGVISAPDPADAFTLLYGLVIQDVQIRVLLGDPSPPPEEIAARATTAIDRFLTLLAPPVGSAGGGPDGPPDALGGAGHVDVAHSEV